MTFHAPELISGASVKGGRACLTEGSRALVWFDLLSPLVRKTDVLAIIPPIQRCDYVCELRDVQ
jgi:hypothetical protein